MNQPDDQLLDYVLDLLEPNERMALETVLATDPVRCAEVHALRQAMQLLVDDLPSVEPPALVYAQLEHKFKTVKQTTLPALTSALPRQTRKAPSLQRRQSPVPRFIPWLISGLVVISALFLGINTYIGRETMLLTAYLNDPTVRKIDLKNEEGQLTGLLLLRQNGQMLVDMNTAPPEGQVFQAWGVTGPANKRVATSIGLSTTKQFEVDIRKYPIIWISIEPTGGSAKPTKKVGRSKLS